MPEMRDLVGEYLEHAKVMQLATVSGGRPWICSVYFVFDDKNLYWLSWPSRRHSQEIAAHDRVAVAVAIKLDRPVIGIQAEGRGQMVSDPDEVKRVMRRYVDKYGEGQEFYGNFLNGKNQHEMYRFTPEKLVLLDEEHFKGAEARQEIKF